MEASDTVCARTHQCVTVAVAEEYCRETPRLCISATQDFDKLFHDLAAKAKGGTEGMNARFKHKYYAIL